MIMVDPIAEKNRTGLFEIDCKCIRSDLAHRDDSLLAALAKDTKQESSEIDSGHRQANEFRHAESGPIENFEHRHVSKSQRSFGTGRFDQCRRLLLSKDARKSAYLLGCMESFEELRIDRTLLLRIAENPSDRDQYPGTRARGHLTIIEVGSECRQVAL